MDKKLNNGIFTISLDFEIHWGVSEKRTIESYGDNLSNVPNAVNRLLQLFQKNEINATWGAVGMLLCDNKEQIEKMIGKNDRPIYENNKLSNYRLLPTIGNSIKEDPYHYAKPLVKKISQTPGQEIATHTFSHYYCLEKGQSLDNFEKDIDAALKISSEIGYEISSIIFPRNQYADSHIDLLYKKGIKYYRGNETHWMYNPRNKSDESIFHKLGRLIDAYVKISNDNTHALDSNKSKNIPSSRFLRPYDPKLKLLDNLRLNRICKEMTYAAKTNRLYHMWWHPHNFGKHLEENISFLSKILKHYQHLNKEFGFESLNMKEVGQLADEKN